MRPIRDKISSHSYDFSIITPFYRGTDYLSDLHNNLLAEVKKYKVEWIIVDDFSDDNNLTKISILNLKNTSKLEIVPFFLKRNYYGSKATITGARFARAPYSIILDQDDHLAPNALDIFSKYIEKYSANSDFAGVCARCINLSGFKIGTHDFKYEIYTNENYIRHRYKIDGEMLQCTKTNILKEYFYLMRPGHTNGYIWNKIAKNYKYIYISEVVRIYNTENVNSVSKVREIRYVGAQCQQIAEYLTDNFTLMLFDYKNLLINCIHFGRLCIHSKSIIHFSKVPYYIKLIIIILFPFSYMKAIKDKYDNRI